MSIGILWDLDGTLLDTLEDLVHSVNHVMVALGYPTHSREAVRRYVGNGVRRLMELAVPEGGDVEAAYNLFRSYYPGHCQEQTAPYPGICDALQALSRYPMAVVSNKPDEAVKPLCAQYFPGLYARGESPTCPRKPAPDMVLQTMEQLGVDGCIYVGDSEVDVATARNAGVPCLSVTWGFRDRDALSAAGAHIFCEKSSDLKDIIEEMMDHYGK